MSDQVVIRRAGADAATARALADVLVDSVEGGASVGFMSPLTHDRAEAFWAATLDAAARGERIELLAEEAGNGAIIGTVQVIVSPRGWRGAPPSLRSCCWLSTLTGKSMRPVPPLWR